MVDVISSWGTEPGGGGYPGKPPVAARIDRMKLISGFRQCGDGEYQVEEMSLPNLAVLIFVKHKYLFIDGWWINSSYGIKLVLSFNFLSLVALVAGRSKKVVASPRISTSQPGALSASASSPNQQQEENSKAPRAIAHWAEQTSSLIH